MCKTKIRNLGFYSFVSEAFLDLSALGMSLQERVKIFLTHCTDEDIIKLAKLIEVYTMHSGYLEGVSPFHFSRFSHTGL